jgi:pantoate--beta-alanine ligase
VRDPDNLAMSSRNVYLTPNERSQAVSLSRALEMARQEVLNHNRDGTAIMAKMQMMLIESGVLHIDYAVIACPDTLIPIHQIQRLPVIALIAAWIGATRLIDNMLISEQ